jgi:ferredoxin
MRVHVDLELCDSHGQCVFAAPAVFELDDVGELHYEPQPPETERPAVERAARLCPVRAITLEK